MINKSKIVICNAFDVMNSINRGTELLEIYTKQELGVSTNVNANDKSMQIYIKMNRNSCEKNISSLMKKFIVKYVQCRQCKSLSTTMETTDTYKCSYCHSVSSIHI